MFLYIRIFIYKNKKKEFSSYAKRAVNNFKKQLYYKRT